jgi:hypothetical protein
VISAILAHQGGWDEMLMVAGPIGIFAYILRRANQRAEKAAALSEEGGGLVGDNVVEGSDVGPE